MSNKRKLPPHRVAQRDQGLAEAREIARDPSTGVIITDYALNGEQCCWIGGQQTACADITIQWRVKLGAAGSLFSDYANQGDLMTTVENAVVVRELKQVVNGQLGDYNPITDVQTVVNTNSANSQFSRFGPVILTAMRGDIGNRVDVLTVLMPFIHYDSQVEGKLNAIQQSFANAAIAQENVKVNQAQAQAYQKLGNPTLNQLVNECLQSTAQHAAGWSCFPGANSGLAISAGK